MGRINNIKFTKSFEHEIKTFRKPMSNILHYYFEIILKFLMVWSGSIWNKNTAKP